MIKDMTKEYFVRVLTSLNWSMQSSFSVNWEFNSCAHKALPEIFQCVWRPCCQEKSIVLQLMTMPLKNEMHSNEHFTFAMGCLFCFCIFSHSANNIQEPMVHIRQVQFFFLTSKYGNIGPFFQKILLEKLQPLSSVTKRQKSSLLCPPSSPPSKKYSDCKN